MTVFTQQNTSLPLLGIKNTGQITQRARPPRSLVETSAQIRYNVHNRNMSTQGLEQLKLDEKEGYNAEFEVKFWGTDSEPTGKTPLNSKDRRE